MRIRGDHMTVVPTIATPPVIMCRRRTVLVALLCAMLSGACGGSQAVTNEHEHEPARPDVLAGVIVPATPVGRQLMWVADTLGGAREVDDAASMQARFTAHFLEAVPPDQLVATANELRTSLPGFRLVEIESAASPHELVALATSEDNAVWRIYLSTESSAPYRIDSFLLQAAPDRDPDRPSTWEDLYGRMSDVAPVHALLAAEIVDGVCDPIRSNNADRVMPLGSTFKLYVLEAVAHSVNEGHLAWDDALAVDDALRSLPSGVMQDLPTGFEVPIREAAEQMIAISDNTATDHLIARVGRDEVERAVARAGHHAPHLMTPFLMTRDLFYLKLGAEVEVRARFSQGSVDERREILASDYALPSIASARWWLLPVEIERIEWFASSEDICRLYARLAEMADADSASPIMDILSINPGVRFDPSHWPYIGYKGGSEPGVLHFAWFLQDPSGRSFVYVMAFMNTERPVDLFEGVRVASWGGLLLAEEVR